MRYLKTLGLLAVAAVVLMAFAGGASATVTSPTGTTYTGELHGTSSNATLTGGVVISCSNASVRGSTSGGATSWTVTSLKLSECGKDTSTVIDSEGNPTEHGGTISVSGGTVYSTGLRVTVLTHFSIFNITVHCIYNTNNTSLGTMTSSHTTGSTAMLHLNGQIPQNATDEFCGSTELEGNFTVTTPDSLYM